MMRMDAEVTLLLKEVVVVTGMVTVAMGPPLGQEVMMVLVVERMYCSYSALFRLVLLVWSKWIIRCLDGGRNARPYSSSS